MKHSVVRFDESNLAVLPDYARHARGYRRAVMVDHDTSAAAVHMAHQIVQLESGGSLEPNVLAYEKALFVLDGELDIMLDARVYRLVKGDYALVLAGSTHAFRSSSGDGARWLEMIAPQPLAQSVGGDTFFRGAG